MSVCLSLHLCLTHIFRNSFYSEMFKLSLEPPGLLFSAYHGSFSGVMQTGHNVSHSPPSSTQVKNDYSYTSTPHVCLNGTHREIFTLFSSSKYLENHTLDAHRKGLVITLKYHILAKTEMYQYIIVKIKIKFHEYMFSGS